MNSGVDGCLQANTNSQFVADMGKSPFPEFMRLTVGLRARKTPLKLLQTLISCVFWRIYKTGGD